MFKKLNLFSKTDMKLLIFISVKDGEFYERQIANEAKISVGAVNSILKRFDKMSLVRKTKKGRMLFYGRNDSSPLLRQFKVFITINNLIPIIDNIGNLARRIVLFGSCSEGRNGEQSDIDLFILSREKETIKRRLDRYPRIQAIILDTVEYATLEQKDRPLYERIERGIDVGWEDG